MDFSGLEKQIGISFRDLEFYERAFTHRSYLNEHPEIDAHNERLEFLGDAVVELIVTSFLFKHFPDKPEGELTALRAAMVRRKTLSEIGQELDFEKYLRLSKGEAKNTAKAKALILSNTTEAFIGALYLDLGLEIVEKFLTNYLLPKIEEIMKESRHIDAKSHFQEIIQERQGITPHYKIESSSGPDHKRKFTVGVYVNDEQLATGEGSSKREAETAAAAKALEKFN
ncbi:MAG: ribonuclease III [Patescibacteria group bacterium]|nr:ribonuclease III [Patescibacteria group bacterium]